MDQITKIVNQFLSAIVGVGLLCFASFVFLLASAQLNDSLLGDLLARVAGETARTARTESFSYWGRVGGEVATGLGYARPLSGEQLPSFTPVAIIVTAPPAGSPPPGATPTPTNFIRSSPFSEGGLLLWRGLNERGERLPLGVSLRNVEQQALAALQENPGDLLAIWLFNRVRGCEVAYADLIGPAEPPNYEDPANADTIRAAAETLIARCNPRLFEAYGRRRWAEIAVWITPSEASFDETPAQELLQGLTIKLGAKDGPARARRDQDLVEVTVQGIREIRLGDIHFSLSVKTLNALLAGVNWQPGDGQLYTIAGELFPAEAPEPPLPAEADLTPPTGSPTPDVNTSGAGAPSTPGRYVVRGGDTIYSIARQFNVTPQAIIDANQATIGFNPNYITVGMELIIPAPAP